TPLRHLDPAINAHPVPCPYFFFEPRRDAPGVHWAVGGHSMIWSARPSTDCGIFRPSAFAVLRLMTSSNLVGCSTGRSPGFVPRRMLSTLYPARLNRSLRSTPYA